LVVDPPERDEKKPVLANCLMLMPNVIETEINIYIYWYKKRHQPNQIPSGNQTWFAEKSTICSWFSHSNFHFDRGCPIIATFDVNDASPGQEPLKSRRISSPRQTSL
jgi:hypothetical protein